MHIKKITVTSGTGLTLDEYDGQQASALLKASKVAATYVCSDCGHEQDSMDRHCDACNSVRVVAIAVLEQALGPKWREAFA